MSRNPPLLLTSAETIHSRVNPGDIKDKITQKRIWKDSEIRMVEDNYINREKAFEIDALTRLIITVETYTILGKPHLVSDDNIKYKDLIEKIEKKIFDDLNLISVLRGSMPYLKKHGSTFFQKRYETGTITQSEIRPIKSVEKIEYVEKYSNPFDPSDFYLFQNVKIPTNWRDPISTLKKQQKIWYIRNGKNGIKDFTKINQKEDIIVDLNNIIEIKNNESGESSITACLTEIFIKNLIFMQFPNLVGIVVSPALIFSHSTKEEDGVPQAPDIRKATSNPSEYEHELNEYNTFKTNMATLLNNLETDWAYKGIVSMPDYIKAEILESTRALDPGMLNTMLDRLNREISFALNFPLSLLDAQGAELTTSRNILTTISLVMKGIQDQYVTVVQRIIEEQFPEAIPAGITFSFSELDPKDEKDIATIDKLHADIIKIYHEIGANENDIKTLSSHFDLLQKPELGGSGVIKSGDTTEYDEEDILLAGRTIARIMEESESNLVL
jgi:hypothetical protein